MNTIIIDAKSGTSGAGRGAKLPNLYCEVNENIKAYGVASHRHTPEIEEQLGYAAGEEICINFLRNSKKFQQNANSCTVYQCQRKLDTDDAVAFVSVSTP